MTPRLTPERVRGLLAEPPHDSGDPADVRIIVDGPRELARRKMALCVASEVLALHDALARVTREREAAVAARDALVTAVREYMDSSRAAAGDYLRATLADDHKAALADVDRRHSGRRLNATARLTALLDGAPADVVRGDVVRAYLDAQTTATQRGATNADVDALRAARAALDAALAPGGGR